MDTFCVLPWFGKEINWNQRETSCCLLPAEHDIEEIKKDMLAGVRSTACQKCWNLEDNKLQSDRQLKNAALDWYWDRDIELIKQDAINSQNDVLMLKLNTSFTCNATCVSCNPSASSAWYQLDAKIQNIIPIKKYKFIDLDQVNQKIDFSKLKTLSLLGGEPLYEKKNFDLLEHMLNLGNNTVFLSIVTNGSVVLTSRQKKILSQFKNLNFSLSIDGIDRVFEYLRFPLKWNLLQENLQFFREVTDNISANYTLSNLNIMYHNQTTAWFTQNNIPFANNPIYTPAWLQPRTLPAASKKHLETILSQQDYDMYIGQHSVEDDEKFQQCILNIQQQDRAKNINIKDYLPEFCEMTNWPG